MKIAGIILGGGESKRMGQPKAWLPIGGEPMIARVVRRLSEAVHPIFLVAAVDQDLPDLPGDVRIVRDSVSGMGPLQGLAAGLEALRGVADAAFVCGCDAPFIGPAFVHRMGELLGSASICVPFVDHRRYPLAGVYRVEVMEIVQQMLSENVLRVGALLERVPTRFAEAHELIDVDPTLASLRNVNTPEEYEQALASLS